MKRTIAMSAAMAFASVGLAQMSEGPQPFSTLDANKDGAISVTEAQEDPRLLDVFASLDTNQDGSLDRGEYAAIAQPEQQ